MAGKQKEELGMKGGEKQETFPLISFKHTKTQTKTFTQKHTNVKFCSDKYNLYTDI